MKKALMLSAVVLAVAFSLPAAAAMKKGHVKADATTCQSMMQQLDDAITSHATSPKIDSAKKHRADGEAACTAGKFSAGVKQYRLGMRELGVKPMRK
ncbi:MAG: hypothetical protein WCF16_08550 [Alphaproteobacteria bacterium]